MPDDSESTSNGATGGRLTGGVHAGVQTTDVQHARAVPPAAQRALAEAAARRTQAAAPMPLELGGRDGPEPVRYGDWERKGLAVDF